MKNTPECLEFVRSHPWLSKGFAKLKKADLVIITEFLDRDFASKSDAMVACNRIFVDAANRPKQWTTILEIISAIITHRYN